MRQSDSRTCPQNAPRDGWTPARQLAVLEILARARSVTAAARAAGMSRESAYRLRRRPSAALFAAAWDQALRRPALSAMQGHKLVNFASPDRPQIAADFRRKSAKGHKVDEVDDAPGLRAAQSSS